MQDFGVRLDAYVRVALHNPDILQQLAPDPPKLFLRKDFEVRPTLMRP